MCTRRPGSELSFKPIPVVSLSLYRLDIIKQQYIVKPKILYNTSLHYVTYSTAQVQRRTHTIMRGKNLLKSRHGTHLLVSLHASNQGRRFAGTTPTF